MKISCAVICLVLCFSPLVATAQDIQKEENQQTEQNVIQMPPFGRYQPLQLLNERNIIKINPLLIGHYQLSYERLLNERNSISVSGLYSTTTEFLYKSVNDDERSKTIDADAWKLYLEHRYYFKHAPNSYFLGTYARYGKSNEDVQAKTNTQNYNHTRTTSNTAFGLVLGKQYSLGKQFMFDWYAGGMGEYLKREKLEFENSSITRNNYEEDFLEGKKLDRWRPNIRLGLSFGYRF